MLQISDPGEDPAGARYRSVVLQNLRTESVRAHLAHAGAVSVNGFWHRRLWGSLQERDDASALEDVIGGNTVTNNARLQEAQRKGLAQGP